MPLEERKYKDMNQFGEGEQAKICLEIMQRTGAHLELSLAKDQGLSIMVSGKLDAVMKARKDIVARLQTQVGGRPGGSVRGLLPFGWEAAGAVTELGHLPFVLCGRGDRKFVQWRGRDTGVGPRLQAASSGGDRWRAGSAVCCGPSPVPAFLRKPLAWSGPVAHPSRTRVAETKLHVVGQTQFLWSSLETGCFPPAADARSEDGVGGGGPGRARREEQRRPPPPAPASLSARGEGWTKRPSARHSAARAVVYRWVNI